MTSLQEGLQQTQNAKDDGRGETRNWISRCLDSLQLQHDKLESDLELTKAKKVGVFFVS